ncbi:DUF3789 domain-containing protein [Catenibacterium sp. RTP21428st1_B8_RTP21428_210409]|uniref:DUF3789 domain-containing protein n=2 Tax=unclassified Catenibacterium TaxID=2643636 RepID=UPI0032EC67EA
MCYSMIRLHTSPRRLPQRKSIQKWRNDDINHILFDFFLFSPGAGFGVVTMCLIQAAKAADSEIEMMERKRNNEFRTELIQLVFK